MILNITLIHISVTFLSKLFKVINIKTNLPKKLSQFHVLTIIYVCKQEFVFSSSVFIHSKYFFLNEFVKLAHKMIKKT